MIRHVNKSLEYANNYAVILPITTLIVRTQTVIGFEPAFYETIDIVDNFVRYNEIMSPTDAFMMEQTLADSRRANSRVKALLFAIVGDGIDIRTSVVPRIRAAYTKAMGVADRWKIADVGLSLSDFSIDVHDRLDLLDALDRFQTPIDLYL